IQKAYEVLQDPNAKEAKKAKAQAAIDERPDGNCGPATAILILDMLDNPARAYNTVKGLYKRYGDAVGFTDYRTGDKVAWGKAFASEGKLLWMRRNPHNDNCVLDYWRECVSLQ